MLFLALGMFTVGLGLTYGPQAAWYSEIFPASIRFSGVSISYALGAILGGAFAPTIATALVQATGTSSVGFGLPAGHDRDLHRSPCWCSATARASTWASTTRPSRKSAPRSSTSAAASPPTTPSRRPPKCPPVIPTRPAGRSGPFWSAPASWGFPGQRQLLQAFQLVSSPKSRVLHPKTSHRVRARTTLRVFVRLAGRCARPTRCGVPPWKPTTPCSPRSPRWPAKPGPSLTRPPGQPVGEAPVHTVEDLEAAIAAAAAAQPAWAALGHDARSAALLKAADAVERSAEELAQLLSREQGKPLNGPNARFEVGACAAWLRATAGTPLDPRNRRGRRRNPRRAALPAHRRRRRDRPVELAHDDHHLADRPGPADGQHRRGQALRIHAAVRPGPGRGPQRGTPRRTCSRSSPAAARSAPALAEHPDVGKVMFTGSTATGKAIIKSSADTVKRLTLELGGNDAGIVLPDADPKAIAEGLFWGAFINTGQTCAALKRLYVHDRHLRRRLRGTHRGRRGHAHGRRPGREERAGPAAEPGRSTTSSPGSSTPPATPAPGSCSAATPTPTSPATSTPTTLVADIDNDNPLVAEEQFGPALPIIRYSTVDEAVAMANAPRRRARRLGLVLRPGRRPRGRRPARGRHRLDQHARRRGPPMIPFGGAKQSGYGLEFGVEGLKAARRSPGHQRLTLHLAGATAQRLRARVRAAGSCGGTGRCRRSGPATPARTSAVPGPAPRR